MNVYLLSLLFGVVEGLTEFLPVSSTAHLRLVKPLLGVSLGDPYWKMYDVVIQLGAILAVVLYFRGRIVTLLKTFPTGSRGDRNWLTHPLSLVMTAFVVTAVPAFLLTKLISKNLESLAVMGSSLLIGGVVMWAVDAIFGTPRGGRPMPEETAPAAPPAVAREARAEEASDAVPRDETSTANNSTEATSPDAISPAATVPAGDSSTANSSTGDSSTGDLSASASLASAPSAAASSARATSDRATATPSDAAIVNYQPHDPTDATPTTPSIEQMRPWQAAWIGAVQILSAVFPGTSRSMSTIAAGQTAGLTRSAALEFSFFLSIPIMFAACGYDLLKTVRAKPGSEADLGRALTGQDWGVLAVGFGVSFIVAFAVIAWFMAWVRRRGFVPFAIYRILIGVIVLIVWWTGRA